MTRDWGLVGGPGIITAKAYFKAVLLMRNYTKPNIITLHGIHIILFPQHKIDIIKGSFIILVPHDIVAHFSELFQVQSFKKKPTKISAHLTSQGHISPRHRHGVLRPLKEVGRLWKQKTRLTRHFPWILKTFCLLQELIDFRQLGQIWRRGQTSLVLLHTSPAPSLQVFMQTICSFPSHTSLGGERGEWNKSW